MKEILQRYRKIGLVLAVLMAVLFVQKTSAQTANVNFDYVGNNGNCNGDNTYTSGGASVTVQTTGIFPANANITAISLTGRFVSPLLGTTITWTLNNTIIGNTSGTGNCVTGNIAGISIPLFNMTGSNTLAVSISGGLAPGVYHGTLNVTYCLIPNAPAATNGSRCGPGTVSISATPGAGEVIDWYANETGGPALATGTSSLTIPNLSATTIYYAEARNTLGGCVSPTRTAVTAAINTIPVTSVDGQSNLVCFGGSEGSITISVSGGTGNYFYSVNTGTPIYTSNAFPSPYTYGGLSANTQYRIRVKDSTTQCESK